MRVEAMLVVAMLALPALASGQVPPGEISVFVEPGLPSRGTHGYTELRLLVSNSSATSEHHVTLEIPGEHHLSNNPFADIRTVRRSLMVSPRASLSVSLFYPELEIAGSNLAVTVDRRRRSIVPLALPSRPSPYSHNQPYRILVGSGLSIEPLLQLSDEGMGASIEQLDPGLPPLAELQGTSWLAYSGYDCIALAGHDTGRLPAQVQAALEGYLRCGGTLMIIGEPEQTLSWPVEVILDTQLRAISYGFGSCLVIGSEGPQLDKRIWQAAREEWRSSAEPWNNPGYYDLSEELAGMAVVEGLRIPVRSLFLLMIGFAVVIGPVNLLLLKRRRRQLWLLWTVPLISVVTSAGIFIYALIAEGLTTLVRIEGVTLLDQPNQRATTIGGIAYYSPLTPGDGLHFPVDAELSPQIPWGQMTPGRVIDWSHDQHFSRGWVSARLPAHFKWRSDAHCRQRLVVRPGTGDRPEVVNGLGTRIRELWLAGSAGTIFHARDLAEGATTTLGPASFSRGPTRSSLRVFFDKPWYSIDTTIRSWLVSLLDPGTYVALVEVNSFIEPGLPEYELVKSSGVICGVYADGVSFAGRSVVLPPAPAISIQEEDADDAG
jgi:hypothetical protein